MKFTTDFRSMSFDLRGYYKRLMNHLRKMNSQAGSDWIKAAVDETPIPTWSGASRATFLRLALDLGTSIPIGPIRAEKSRISLGLATSAGSGVTESKAAVGFTYTTDLRYLAYNEFNRAVAGKPPKPYSNNVRFTPYGFRGRAAAAWQKKADQVKLPNPLDYLDVRRM